MTTLAERIVKSSSSPATEVSRGRQGSHSEKAPARLVHTTVGAKVLSLLQAPARPGKLVTQVQVDHFRKLFHELFSLYEIDTISKICAISPSNYSLDILTFNGYCMASIVMHKFINIITSCWYPGPVCHMFWSGIGCRSIKR